MKILLLIFFFGLPAFAIDSAKCSTMLNDGMWKKYKWGGVGESNAKAMTAETKTAGSTTATSRISTEGSTAISDPVYYTNISRSQTQSLSSWGACSLFALQERKQQREQYVRQNFDQIKKDIANGDGLHMETLSWFSLCDDQALDSFNETLQQKFVKLGSSAEADFSKNMDQIVADNKSLTGKCINLSKIASK